MTGNLEKYPAIVQPPKKVIVDGEDYTVYKFIFKGLSDLYNYLPDSDQIKAFVRFIGIERCQNNLVIKMLSLDRFFFQDKWNRL